MTDTGRGLGEWIHGGEPSRALCLASLLGVVGGVFGKKVGGWRLLPDVELHLGGETVLLDVAGWRRERLHPSAQQPLALAPDWACEILTSTSHARDTLRRLRQCHAANVKHYWVVDPSEGALLGFVHEPRGFVNVLSATRTQVVRVEPFEAVELRVAALFGEEGE